jgi:hypothetical protein
MMDFQGRYNSEAQIHSEGSKAVGPTLIEQRVKEPCGV